MRAYRIVNAKYANDLSGEGARLHGGRWNHIGIPCVYTSESRSLAVLEFSVNVNLERIIRNLNLIELELPDDIQTPDIASLPGNWRETPAPFSTREFGTALLTQATHPVIRMPSSVVPEEFNYIINPRHPKAIKCRLLNVLDFVYDIRIKTGK